MHRLLPAMLLLSACTRLGFTVPPDAVPADAVSADAVPADAALVDIPPAAPWPDSALPDRLHNPETYAGVLQNTGSGPVFRLLFGMADNKFLPLPTAHVHELKLDASTNTVVDQGFLATYPGALKALDLDAHGRLLLAHYRPAPFTLDIVEISPALKLAGTLALSHAADPPRVVEHTHALCFLPGGNFLVAAGTNADNNHFNEYDPGGNLVRGVLTSKLAPNALGSSVSFCISRSDLELYVHESAMNAEYGRLLRLTRPTSGAAWTVTDTVAVADIAAKLGAAATQSWSIALDQKNDRVYLAPFMPSAVTINQLIRCPATGFSAASCVTVGDPLPGADTTDGSVVKSMAQIPGTDDLLLFNHGDDNVAAARKLYRYSAQSATWTELFDLRQISGGYAQPQGYPLLL